MCLIKISKVGWWFLEAKKKKNPAVDQSEPLGERPATERPLAVFHLPAGTPLKWLRSAGMFSFISPARSRAKRNKGTETFVAH